MHAPRKTLTLAALAVTAGLFTGCDDAASADRQTMNAIDAARAARYKGVAGQGDTERYTANQAEYEKALNKSSGSVSAYAANSALGASYLDSARVLIQATHEKEQRATQLLIELRLLGEQVRTGNTIITGYQAAEPKATLDAIAARTGEVQGNGNAVNWQSSDKTALPTLSAIQTETSRLEGVLAEKQQQMSELTVRRQAQLAAAEASQKEADVAKGDASVAAFTKMADARNQAEMLATQTGNLKLEIDRLNDDLAVQKGLAAALTSGIDELKKQGDAVAVAWTETQKQIATQKARIAEISTAEATAPASSLATRTRELAAVLVDLDKARNDALAALNSSGQYYAKAEADAKKLLTDTQAAADGAGARAAGYTALQTTIHPQRAKAQASVALLEKASLYSNATATYSDVAQTRDTLRDALKPTGAEVPAELEDKKIDEQLNTSSKAADEAFTAADAAVSNVADGRGPAEVAGIGKTNELLLLALWSDYYNRQGRAGLMAPDKAKEMADAKMTDALAARDNLRDLKLPVPPLPGELGAPPAAAAPDATAAAPGTQTPSTPVAPLVNVPGNAEPGADVIFGTDAVAGTWTSTPVPTGSSLTLTLNGDGSATFKSINPDPADATKTATVESSGTFAVQGAKLVVTITAMGGGIELTPAMAGPFTFAIRVGTAESTKTQPVVLKAESEKYGPLIRPGQTPDAAPVVPAADPAAEAPAATPLATPATGEETK